MREFNINDVSAGDRVTLEHESGSALVRFDVKQVGSLLAITRFYPSDESYLGNLLVQGWRITAVEKPEAKVELPTERWSVIKFEGTIPFTLDDFGNWRDPFGNKVYIANYCCTPFTRLAPVPETAKAVLDRLVELFDLIDPADSDLVTAWNNVAAEFGVVTS